MINILKKINVFDCDSFAKYIFWLIWDLGFAIFDFVVTQGILGYSCGILMCGCFIIHLKRFIEFRREQKEKVRQLVNDFMDWFPEHYKKMKEQENNV